jgi:hypothetical protein
VDCREAQVRQRRHQPGHRRRVQQLEARIAPGSEGAVHAGPEAAQAVEHDRIEHAQGYDPDQVCPLNPRPVTLDGQIAS